MKKEWKKFIENLDFTVEFLNKDEFINKYKSDHKKFPSAFIKKKNN